MGREISIGNIARLIAKIMNADIEIIEPLEEVVEAEVREAPVARNMTFEQKITILKKIRSHISTDPIRAYLHEIGRIPEHRTARGLVRHADADGVRRGRGDADG